MNDGDSHGDGDRRKNVKSRRIVMFLQFWSGLGVLGPLFDLTIKTPSSPSLEWSGRAGQGRTGLCSGCRYARTHFTCQGTDVHGRF